MPSKVIVAVAKAFFRVPDPKQFLLLAPQQVKSFLRVFGISRPLVVMDLNHEHGHLHSRGKKLGAISAAEKAPILSNSRSMSC